MQTLSLQPAVTARPIGGLDRTLANAALMLQSQHRR